MNYFGMTEKQIRYEISFQNLLMLFSSIPKSKSIKKDEPEKKLTSVAGTLKAANFLGLKVKDNTNGTSKG